ncbi:hypothetical protein HQ531_02490 [bacterium]|nr:hypothetical protein [bacterium]
MSVNVSFPKYTMNAEGQMVLDRNADLSTIEIHRDGALDAAVTATLVNNHDGNYIYQITLTGKYSVHIGGSAQEEHENILLPGEDVITEGMFDDVTIEVVAGVVKVKDGGITTAKLAADAVDDTKIADDAVGTEHIQAGAVDTAELAADAVDDTKIADDAIGTEHIQAGAVDTAELAAEAVETAQIKDGAVTSDKLGSLTELPLTPVSAHLSLDVGNEGKIYYFKNTTAGYPRSFGIYAVVRNAADTAYIKLTLAEDTEAAP